MAEIIKKLKREKKSHRKLATATPTGHALASLAALLYNLKEPEDYTIKSSVGISPALFIFIRCHPWGAAPVRTYYQQ